SLKVVRVFRAAVRARLSRPIWQAFRVNPSNVIGIPDKIVQRSTKLEETARKSLHADNPYRFVVIAWSKRSSIKAQLGEIGGFLRYLGSRRGHGARATGRSLARVTECAGCKAGAERDANRDDGGATYARYLGDRRGVDDIADSMRETWAGHGGADCVDARAGVHDSAGHVHEGFGVGGGVVTLCQNCGVAALFGERGEFAFEPPACGMEPEDCTIKEREPLNQWIAAAGVFAFVGEDGGKLGGGPFAPIFWEQDGRTEAADCDRRGAGRADADAVRAVPRCGLSRTVGKSKRDPSQ